MYSVFWNKLIWQNSLMHAAGCYSVGQVDTFLAKSLTSDKAACEPLHLKNAIRICSFCSYNNVAYLAIFMGFEM